MYWAILSKAGFQADEARLRAKRPDIKETRSNFDPHFKQQPCEQLHIRECAIRPLLVNRKAWMHW